MKTETIEAISDVSSRVTTFGAAASMLGTFLINNMVGIIGLLIALAGYLTNVYYKRKAYELHARESELRMLLMRAGVNIDSGLRHSGDLE